jgi:sugar lactone lactonase YvrE
MHALLWLCLTHVAAAPDSAEALFQAQPIAVQGFSELIEGPQCDAAGNVYAVAYKAPDNIGRVTPEGRAEVFVTLPNKSYGNGIVFDPAGLMYVADYTNHNVLRIDPRTKKIEVYVHEPKMNQPNDLAIAPDGTLYVSDPDWKAGDGQLWKISPAGKLSQIGAKLGTTNGIEVSPDAKTLYVNESKQRTIWRYHLTNNPNWERQPLIQFDDGSLDGMRCDIDGNLYVTRHGKGVVLKISPAGKVLREIDVLGSKPSNLCFGGPDGRTVYVTEVEHTRLVSFRVDRPGLAWQRWQDAKK